jgi:hypothetical protein
LPIHAGSCDPPDIAVADSHRHAKAIIAATISSRDLGSGDEHDTEVGN